MNLPLPPTTQDEMVRWARDMFLALEEKHREVDDRFNNGGLLLKVYDEEPPLSSINEGSFFFVDTGSVRTLYTKVNGAFRTATFS